jgi:hypothetical protein
MGTPPLSSVSDRDEARAAGVVMDLIERTGIRSPSSVTKRQESVSPHRLLPRHCRVCGKRVVRGRLGFLAWVHAEHAPFAHYARV